ncbi:MAG: hypothetical protein AAB263_08165, partial [Planctomycetota bacterium]
MPHRLLALVMMTLSFHQTWTAESGEANPPLKMVNYHSGISLSLAGRNGHDYVIERFYHDALADDRGVIYLRGGTKLALAHNEFNTWQVKSTSPFTMSVINGTAGNPDSGGARQ